MKRWVEVPVWGVVLVIIGIILSCYMLEEARLAGQMPENIRFWYEVHYPLINEFRLSKALAKELGVKAYSEKDLFLHLSDTDKVIFANNFWRWHGDIVMKNEYYARVRAALGYCREEKPHNPLGTDRARILLVCGFPNNVEIMTVEEIEERPFDNPIIRGEPFIGNSMSNEWAEDKKLVEVWTYLWGRGGIQANATEFYFFHRPSGAWELSSGSMTGDRLQFFQWSLERFKPTDEDFKEMVQMFWPKYSRGEKTPEKLNFDYRWVE